MFSPLRKAPWTFSAQGRNRAKGAFPARFRDGAHGSAAAKSASSDRSKPGAWRLFFKVGAGTAATSAALPPPQDEISPRNNPESRRAARRDGFDTCGLPRGVLGGPGAARSGHVPGSCPSRACQNRHSRAKRGRRATRPTLSKNRDKGSQAAFDGICYT